MLGCRWVRRRSSGFWNTLRRGSTGAICSRFSLPRRSGLGAFMLLDRDWTAGRNFQLPGGGRARLATEIGRHEDKALCILAVGCAGAILQIVRGRRLIIERSLDR